MADFSSFYKLVKRRPENRDVRNQNVKVSFEFDDVVSWIAMHFPSSDVASVAISHTDLVAERVLSAAVSQFPDDPRPTQCLTERYMARGALKEALGANERRIEVAPSDTVAFCSALRILLFLNRLKDANSLFQAATAEMVGAVLQEEVARELLIAMIDGGGFDDPALEFDNVFFARAFVENISSITEISRLFSDRYQFEYLAAAKAYVEASGGQMLYVSLDNLFDVSNKSEQEELLIGLSLWSEPGKRVEWLKSKPEHIIEHYGEMDGYSDAFINEIFGGPNHILQSTKIVLREYESPYVNVVGNKRRTVGAGAKAERRILMLGGSDVYGFGADDDHTIASILQSLLNSEDPGAVRVENHGLRGNPLPVCLTSLFQTQINPGDVVVFFGYPKLTERPAILDDLRSHHLSFSRPHEMGEVFIDYSHLGPRGNAHVAMKLKSLFESTSAEPSKTVEHNLPAPVSIDFLKYLIYRNSADKIECSGLNEYVTYVSKIGAEHRGVRGSVAVNCNPMTLGHLHLLEYAASRVDHLYVFVIEEDLSFFTFRHRFEMVERGLSHLPQVTVLPGGRYICTELTYPEYFSKDEVTEVKADASMEAWFFSEYIASALGISVIFLGDEPSCNVTRQYNAKMSEILPKYGIKVDIIPRIFSPSGKVISASSVRKLLKVGDFEGIREIVPDSTLAVLKEHYSPVEVS